MIMKKHSVSRWVAAGHLLIAVLTFILLQSFSSKLVSQMAAERWRGTSNQPFSQTSCFFPVGTGPTEEDILNFREDAVSDLKENGLDGDYLIRDSWCSSGTLSVGGTRGEWETDVIAIGGNYFDFHPLTLINGTYISEDDLMGDRVLLDENLAWRLFGGTELSGKAITVNKVPLVIAGVVAREDDFVSEKANTSETLLFMSLEMFSKFKECQINVYEIVMPEIVRGYSNSLLNSHFSDAVLQTNTRRFSISNLLKIIHHFDRLPMQADPVVLPYWENAARCMEVWCSLLFLLSTVSFACAVVHLIPSLVIYVHYPSRHKRGENSRSKE